MEEATNRDYIDSDPKTYSFRDAAILATWIILWICLGFGFILLTAPYATAADVQLQKISIVGATDEKVSSAAINSFSKLQHSIKSFKTTFIQKKTSFDVTVEANPRSSGGITVELFCQDNTGRFMPIWGGSITKAVSDWDFSENDIRRANIDGCYFAVVDSTAEMGVL